MSDLFAGSNTDTTIVPDKDRVKGQKQTPLDSDVMDLMIKYAYGKKAASGAVGFFLVCTTPDGREVKMTEYFVSGDGKGNKTYYEKPNKDNPSIMDKFNLPGFSIVESLAKLVTGKGIMPVKDAAGNVISCQLVEDKTIKLYDFKAKQDQDTVVQMFMEMVGKPVSACVLHTIEDQTTKNDATGKYEPNGKTRASNTIDKFLDPQTKKTSAETAANVDSAFAADWKAKWQGKINDESEGSKTAGTKGAPEATGDAAPKASLFK
jgi:hypothetical protein